MSVLTLSEIRTAARDMARDTDSLNYSFDDTTLDRIINRAYVLIRGIDDTRHSYVTASVTGLQFALGDKVKVLAAAANVRRVLEVFEVTGISATDPIKMLERAERWEILQQRIGAANATPTHYSCNRQATATAANVGSWLVDIYPPSDATRYYCIAALVEPTPLSAGTSKPDVDDQTSYAIADMAAAICCRILGMDEAYIASIESRLNAAQKNALAQMQNEWMGRQERP